MFRARDSCGADVRRGRSPKCLFIKATATGNTINGLNDEINKLPEAGLAGASAGRCAAAGQSPRPASRPGPSPGLGCPARPPRPSPAPRTPPAHGRPCPSPTQGHAAHKATLPGHGLAMPLQSEHFWAPTVSKPPKHVTSVPNWEVFGFCFWWSLLGFWVFFLFWVFEVFLLSDQTPASGPPPCPGEGPWKWQKAGISPTRTPSQDCLSDSQFQESCVFLG